MTSGSRSRRHQAGFVIVGVLWILAALAVLAAIYSTYVRTTGSLFGLANDRLRADVAARGALELVSQRLASGQSRLVSMADFRFRVGSASVHAEVSTESARVDLNTAPPELLSGLFAALGADPLDAETITDRIIGWRSVSRTTSEGADEAFMYRAAGKAYAPRRSAFPHVNEIWLLHNIPDAIVARSIPFLTVYSAKPTVNIIAAAPEVVSGLPGMTAERIRTVLAQRNMLVDDSQLGTLLGPSARYATTEASRVFRVTMHVTLDNDRRLNSEAVILLGDRDVEPYRILSWSSSPEPQ